MAIFGSQLGRKDNVAIGTGVSALAAIIQTAAMDIPTLVVGRLVGGGRCVFTLGGDRIRQAEICCAVGLGIFTAMW